MSKQFIEDVEQALGPVLASYYGTDSCPRSLAYYTELGARIALMRFMRSQTSGANTASKLCGLSPQRIKSTIQYMGYDDFASLPQSKWVVDKIIYKRVDKNNKAVV